MLNYNTATVQELQIALEKNMTSSVELVKHCLEQIEADNHQGRSLHAVISVPPLDDVIATAATLDRERTDGRIRSPLHGIPLIIKDNILTSSELGMDTTGGSIGLVGAKSSRSAALVDRLLQAGMIVMGKANLTEFAGLKNYNMMPGWSAVGGQTQSPFIEGGIKDGETLLGHTAPAGSSTGSAVSVAAGFVPLSLGTETVGSVVLPAGRAGVYAFRAGFGTVPMEGVLHLTPDIDMIGAFGRCTRDLAELASYLLDKPDLLALRPGATWVEPALCVAFADPREWKLGRDVCPCDDPESIENQQIEAYESAVAKLAGLEDEVTTKYPVKLPDANTVNYKDENGDEFGIVSVAFHQLRDLIDAFLQSFDSCRVRSLAELIAYNDAHADQAFSKACPNQDALLAVQTDSSPTTTISAATTHIKKTSRAGLDAVFAAEEADVVAAPADSSFALLAAAAGYPVGVAPFPDLLRPIGRPFGIAFVVAPGAEALLFRFMAVWERRVCPRRPLPPFLE